ERTVGRKQFDQFVREYIDRFRFTSITSEQFIEFVDQKFPGVTSAVNAKTWLYEPDMPANAPVFRSEIVEKLSALAEGWEKGVRPAQDEIKKWNASQTVVYMQRLPRQLDVASCEWLDKNLNLANRGNYEILVEWLIIAAGSDYAPAFQKI